MKLFIAGATGVLGKRVVRLLIAEGHQVVGLSRSTANHTWLKEQGAEPREGDLFNQEQMVQLVAGCDGVLHLATAIPNKSRPTLADWAMNDRIRREGTQNLVAAALHHQCPLYVQQSVTFLYGDQQGGWVDETTPIMSQPGGVLQSAVDMEQMVNAAAQQHHLPAIILRFGTFYSHDSAQTQNMLSLTRKGWFPVIGDGQAYWNMIHVDDAARAVVQAVNNYPQALPHTFNICDDEPVTYGELVAHLAQTLGARKPLRLPVFLANLLLGSGTVRFLLASARGRNQLAQEKLGWRPHYPTYREGFAAEIQE